MLTKTPHLFDDATRVTAGDSCWQGKTSPDYWAFVGPFGGCTAPARADRPSAAGGRSVVADRKLLRAGRRRRLRSRRPHGQGQPFKPALVRGDDAGRR